MDQVDKPIQVMIIGENLSFWRLVVFFFRASVAALPAFATVGMFYWGVLQIFWMLSKH